MGCRGMLLQAGAVELTEEGIEYEACGDDSLVFE